MTATPVSREAELILTPFEIREPSSSVKAYIRRDASFIVHCSANCFFYLSRVNEDELA